MSLPDPYTYQVYAKDKIVALRRTAIIAPPGAGKTRPIIEALDELSAWKRPVLVLCTGAAIPTWLRQIPLWSQYPELKDLLYIVGGKKQKRHHRMALWDQAIQFEMGVYITNYSLFYRDYNALQAVPWGTVIADEYHKVMRSHKKTTINKKTGHNRLKTYGLFAKMTLHTPNLVLLTGSLMRRDASSMFTAFQSVAPKTFSSYWRYVNEYCWVEEGSFGQTVSGVRNAPQLRNMMDEYFAYIPPEVVADQLPEGKRLPIMVEIDDEQARIYRDLEEDMMSIVGDTIILTPSVLAKLTKQRQLLCCPRILDPSLGLGAGYEAVVDKLDQESHVAIFVPFRAACDHFQEALIKKGYKNVYILRGGITPEEQIDICEKFRQTKGIVICTIAYAESFDLETCDTSYFIGYDLTVDQNEQAEGRTRRNISKHKFITWNYIKTTTQLDMHFLAKLGEDTRNHKLVMGRSIDYIRKLKGGSIMKLPIMYDKAHYRVRKEAREQYIEEQKGLCWYCKGTLEKDPPKKITDKSIDWSQFPSHFLDHPIHLQHSHKTGLTEGAVHAYCNAVLWEYHGR